MVFFLSVIIPCYNESERINLLIEALKEFRIKADFRYEIIVVNDGSTDTTIDILDNDPFIKQLKLDGIFRILQQEKNQGKGQALKTGIKSARGQYLLTMDADVSTHPTEVIHWLKQCNNHFPENTIFIGSREHPGSEIKTSQIRRAVGRVFNLLVRIFIPLKLKDTQCGFKLYPNKEGKYLFEKLENIGWAHDVEILFRAHLRNMKIMEMKIKWDNAPGSKISIIKDSLVMLKEIIKISIRLRFKKERSSYGSERIE